MIAELFYPEELKIIIADLRAKDNLNEATKDALDSYIKKHVSITFFLTIISLLAGLLSKDLLLFGFSCVAATFIFFPSINSLKKLIKESVKRYQNSGKAKATVTRFLISNGIGGSSWSVYYSYLVDEKEIEARLPDIPNDLLHIRYKKGDTFNIIYDTRDPSISIPEIPTLIRTFKLNKSDNKSTDSI